MSTSPGILLTIVAFALVIGPLVFVHEMGHYLVGRWFGIGADVFSIGFGREIVGWTDKRGTRWKLSALPLGGYVKFAGDMNPASQPSADWLALPAAQRQRTFQAKPVWQRALVVLAGPAVNFLVAALILGGFAMINGVDATPPVIGSVIVGSPAAKAGLKSGDRVVTISGRGIATFKDLADYAVLRPGALIEAQIERRGTPLTVAVRIGEAREVDRFGNVYRLGRLGVTASKPAFRRVGLAEAPIAGLKATWQQARGIADGLWQIIIGRRSIDELGGPIKIAQLSGEVLSVGPETLVLLIALISVNLGFINLLPIPMLDGGHLFFYAIEAVRRRPVGQVAQEWAFRSGLAVVLTWMIVLTINDLGHLGLWKSLAGLIG